MMFDVLLTSLYTALARLILARWPPDKETPRSPTRDRSPYGNCLKSGPRQHA